MMRGKDASLFLRTACLDAHTADILSDIVCGTKLLELLKASPVVELFNLLLYGLGRADKDALATRAARSLPLFIGL
jgi:hypothetical protein